MLRRLADPPYLAFPFSMRGGAPKLATRAEHIRGQIEQVLFTAPGERVFRPEFGAGVKALLFEPNIRATQEVVRKRLLSSLAQALAGEVDARTLEVDVSGENERLTITVAYTLAAIGHRETHRFQTGEGE